MSNIRKAELMIQEINIDVPKRLGRISPGEGQSCAKPFQRFLKFAEAEGDTKNHISNVCVSNCQTIALKYPTSLGRSADSPDSLTQPNVTRQTTASWKEKVLPWLQNLHTPGVAAGIRTSVENTYCKKHTTAPENRMRVSTAYNYKKATPDRECMAGDISRDKEHWRSWKLGAGREDALESKIRKRFIRPHTTMASGSTRLLPSDRTPFAFHSTDKDPKSREDTGNNVTDKFIPKANVKERSLLEEVKDKVGYDSMIFPAMGNRKTAPWAKHPLAVCFSLPTEDMPTHLTIKRWLESEADVNVTTIRYDAISVRGSGTTPGSKGSRWVVTLGKQKECEKLVNKGLNSHISGRKIVIKHFDDILKSEYETSKNINVKNRPLPIRYHSKLEEFTNHIQCTNKPIRKKSRLK